MDVETRLLSDVEQCAFTKMGGFMGYVCLFQVYLGTENRIAIVSIVGNLGVFIRRRNTLAKNQSQSRSENSEQEICCVVCK